MNEKVSLVFFGSGPVAAESLRKLLNTFDIEAVITKPSTKNMLEAAAQHAPVFCVQNKQELSDLVRQHAFRSQVGVLIDFGIIVDRFVIEYFPKGIINSHFSLLPEWRGADPITFAILSGQKETGVSLMLLVEAMDEGPLLGFGIQPLSGTETTPQLTDQLISLSDTLLNDMLPSYITDQISEKTGTIIHPRSQEEICNMRGMSYSPTYSRKLTKEDGIIDWSKPAEQLEREIRAFLEWPKSRAFLGSIDCVITKASVIDMQGTAGKLFIHGKKLAVYCAKDALCLEMIKPAGKKEMSSEAFLAGYKQRLPLS